VRYASGLTRDTYLLSFTSLFADVSTEMLYPVLPIFVTQVLGASAGTLGGIEGCDARRAVQTGWRPISSEG
jgi:hypothetical protein